MLSIVDIVLNHTANDSPWILDHPEATYNTDDCPHLWSAWLLDKALVDFSLDYSKKKVPECPAAPYIGTAADLGKVMAAIQKRVIDPLRLYEFFLCDVATVLREDFLPAIQNIEAQEAESYKKQFEDDGWFMKKKFDVLANHLTKFHGGKERMGVKLKMPEAAIFFMLSNNRNRTAATKEIEALLC